MRAFHSLAHIPVNSLLLAVLIGSPAVALAQATGPAVFVSNNGNLEGSATAFRIAPGGALEFVNRIITGSRPSTTVPCGGCNAYEIALAPGGRWLATVHAAGDVDGITIFEVASDASLTQRFQLILSDGLRTPLDVLWLDDELLLVNELDPTPDRLTVYRWNPATPGLTQTAQVSTGVSNAYLLKHPALPVVYANDSSSARLIYSYTVNPLGQLTPLEAVSTGAPFALELAITPDGRWLYAACGISSGGRAVLGYAVDAEGRLSQLPGSPFTSPGSSPSNVFTSRDSRFLFVGHGTDATVHSFAIDQDSGALTPAGGFFDVGLQGTLGDVATSMGQLFVTDNSSAIDGLMGIYSFGLNPDGTFTQIGPISSTQGIAPRSIAVWDPPVTFSIGDMNCDGVVNFDDIDGFVLAVIGEKAYQAAYPECDYRLADADESGQVDFDDIAAFVARVILGG